MYHYSKLNHRKIIHTEACYITKLMAPGTFGTFDTLHEASSAGYRLCIHCNPIVKQLRAEEEALVNYCFKNGMAFYFEDQNLSISSSMSKWMIIVSPAGKTMLYHKNTKALDSDSKSPVPGYHDQKVHYDSLQEYFEYINTHDRYRVRNPEQIITKKEPPRKGTKRWNKEQRKIKNRERHRSANNVLNIINSFDTLKH